jgi:hypothetical protein
MPSSKGVGLRNGTVGGFSSKQRGSQNHFYCGDHGGRIISVETCATNFKNSSVQRCVISDSGRLKGARVLITGGAGMIGSTIAHPAVAQGAQVTILDAMLPLYGANVSISEVFSIKSSSLRVISGI